MRTIWIGVLAVAFVAGTARGDGVAVTVVERLPDPVKWDLAGTVSDRFDEPALAFSILPDAYDRDGFPIERSNPFALTATLASDWNAGPVRILVRSREAAKLWLDGNLIVEIPPVKPGTNGHNAVTVPPAPTAPSMPPLQMSEKEKVAATIVTAGRHELRLEVVVGGKNRRAELGEVVVAVALGDGPFRLMTANGPGPEYTADAWDAFRKAAQARHAARDTSRRQALAAAASAEWGQRHAIATRVWAGKAPLVPAASARLSANNAIDHFLNARLDAAGLTPPPDVDDLTFLRRVTLDVVGVPPTPEEIAAFQDDATTSRRARVIDRLLADPRRADHAISTWQDVLAENPGLLKPTLNNTGPFRRYLYQALIDNCPLDRFATDLVRLGGDAAAGGPAGFGISSENDVPMVARAAVLAKAFLATDLQCARCHDAPGRSGFRQAQLFGLAAMLNHKPITLPVSSTVRVAPGGRKPHVKSSLVAGAVIPPAWDLPETSLADLPDGLSLPDSPREQLALLTGPQNVRFAEVAVNRIWFGLTGWGLVEPVDDWSDPARRSPELLRYLAAELATHGYDLLHVTRLILNSRVYQRLPVPVDAVAKDPVAQLGGPARRRLSAEQVLDSLFAVAGKRFDCEELTFDPDARMAPQQCSNLGEARRAWQLVALANERDRPALALPATQPLIDVLLAYGWRESRPNSLTVRDDPPTPLQPMTLANGLAASRIIRLSDDSAFTALALEDRPLPEMIERLVLRILGRTPTAEEREAFLELLSEGYSSRRVDAPLRPRDRQVRLVGWANHLHPEATRIKNEVERQVRAGDPPTARLTDDWRRRMEDAVWALINTPEFVFLP